MKYIEIEDIEQFIQYLYKEKEFKYFAFQNIDFSEIGKDFDTIRFKDCLFLGCKIPSGQFENLLKSNSLFPSLDLPFNQYPSKLYSAEKLYDKYVEGKPQSYQETFDYKVYSHFIKSGKEDASINITLAQRIHDHAITDALYDFLKNYNERKIVAIMGGHNIRRDAPEYRKVAFLSKKLCEKSFLMVSGGGPGSMEATHLGAWFAGRHENELNQALSILESAPDFRHKQWLDTAMKVINKFPRIGNFESLGVPTWYFGHEPATPFASKIAKYFANSIREDGLLTIAKGGIIFTPGSAGTMQEIFQDATQNHYKIFGYASPMIFYGKSYWENEMPVFPFLQKLVENGKYQNLIISTYDNDSEIIEEIEKFSKG